MRNVTVAVLLGVALWFPGVRAEAALAVAPSRVVLQGKPKQTLRGFFLLENRGEEALTVHVEPEDWNGGIGGTRGPVSWLTMQPTSLTLRPQHKAKVTYAVRVPKDAQAELRAQVFFTMETAGATPLRSRLGTIVYVAISGTEHIDGEVTKVETAYTATTPGITKPNQLDIAMRIHNRSNIHIVPEGTVVVRDLGGHEIATLTLRAGWGLLPNEEDTYRVVSHDIHLKPGRYTLELDLRCGGDVHHSTSITKVLEAVVTTDDQFHLLN